MSKQDATPQLELVNVQSRAPMPYVSDKAMPVVRLSNLLQEMGLAGPRIPAEQLVGTTFTILRGKPFQSSFQSDAHAWFCVCRSKDTQDVFTTVLGGQAVVDILDALVATGMSNPLEVTLQWKEGGNFSGYYVLE